MTKELYINLSFFLSDSVDNGALVTFLFFDIYIYSWARQVSHLPGTDATHERSRQALSASVSTSTHRQSSERIASLERLILSPAKSIVFPAIEFRSEILLLATSNDDIIDLVQHTVSEI